MLFRSLGSGSDVLDFAGDSTVCAVFAQASAAKSAILADGDYGASGSGYYLYTLAGGGLSLITNGPASAYKDVITANQTVSGINIGCAGRSGTTIYAKLNLGTTASTANGLTVTGTNPAYIGKGGAGDGVGAWGGTIYEVWATSTPWNEASVTAIQQKVLGHLYGSTALSVTRSTIATLEQGDCTAGQCVWTVPAGVARVSSNGLLVESQRTNYVQQSGTISTGTAFTAPWTSVGGGATTVATVAGDPAGGAWAAVTSPGNADIGYQTVTIPSSASWTYSAWIRKASGSGAASILTAGATPNTTGCTCVRSDGGSCTATIISSDYCKASLADLGTTPVRVSVTRTGRDRKSTRLNSSH